MANEGGCSLLPTICTDVRHSRYWIFETKSAKDERFPDSYKYIAKWCRWWASGEGEVYGVIHLEFSMCFSPLVATITNIKLQASTIRNIASYIPPCGAYNVYEYGYPVDVSKSVSEKDEYFSAMAVRRGLDPSLAADKAEVVAFFRRKRVEAAATPYEHPTRLKAKRESK